MDNKKAKHMVMSEEAHKIFKGLAFSHGMTMQNYMDLVAKK